ncbi:copper transpport protein [Didymosphaeria variabile]|uniref:Copper transport protein n=1 Tax=Didymosphaeria variabile TaxID=1932322 RepID=A0A9W8XA72_9PLEO|nr:copper transpport protein [Didymosphaeria variabile]KAJ4345536.1 copper transpport protein [Didymosphaeria variabile]
MNMLFTWDTTDLCIVFKGWHISGTGTLILSLLAIVLMTAGYEAVREASRRYDAHAKKIEEGRRGGDDLSSKPHIPPTFLSRSARAGCIHYKTWVWV